jgi:hypothetical protein
MPATVVVALKRVPVPDGHSAHIEASRLRECYLAFLAGLAALLSLASFGVE